MTTKKMIQMELEKLTDEDIEKIYRFIKEFTTSKPKTKKTTLMSKLREIKIDAPKDFSANFDLYTSGEKRVE